MVDPVRGLISFSVGPDLSWKLEVPSLWDLVQVSAPLAGPVDLSLVGGSCSSSLSLAMVAQAPCVAVEGPSRLPRRRGRPKKVRVGAPVSDLAVDHGEVISRGRVPTVKVSRPRGRPRKGKSLTLSLESEISSSLDPREDGLGSLDNQLVVYDPQSSNGPSGVMARARAALALGVRLGLVYDCFEEAKLPFKALQLISCRVG